MTHTETLNQKKKRIALIAILMILGIAFIGCSPSPSGNIIAKNAQENKELKIGVINFLTGSQAVIGEETNNALMLANKFDNEKSETDRNIKLIIEDSGDDPVKAINAYRKLKAQDVDIIISFGDQVNSAISPIANQDKTLLFMSIVGSDEISGEYSFRYWLTAGKYASIMGDYATNDLNIDTFGIIYINNVYGESYKNTFEKTITNNKGQILSEQSYAIDEKDVKTQVLKTISKTPQAIVVSGFGDAYPLVFKTLREQNWNGIILTESTLNSEYFFNAIGIENLNNTYYMGTVFDRENPTNDDMRFFVNNYEKEFETDSSWIGAFVYDGYNVLAKQMRECNSEPEQLKICLENIETQKGVLGDIHFENHEIDVPILIKKVENENINTMKIYD